MYPPRHPTSSFYSPFSPGEKQKLRRLPDVPKVMWVDESGPGLGPLHLNLGKLLNLSVPIDRMGIVIAPTQCVGGLNEMIRRKRLEQ